MCFHSIKQECRLDYFGFSGIDSNHFKKVRYIHTRAFILIKAVMLLIWIVFCRYSISLSLNEVWNPPWPSYLTNWTIITNVAYLCVSIAIMVQGEISKPKYVIVAVYDNEKDEDRITQANVDDTKVEKKEVSLNCKLLWILHTVVLDANLVVTVAFWTLLYPHFKIRPIWDELCRHGMGLLYIYIESVFIAFPFRLLHTIYSVLFMFGYLLFSLLLFSIGAPPPYPILDWKNDPVSALIYCVMIGVATLLAHFINYILFRLVSLARIREKVELYENSATPLETKTDSSQNTSL